MDVFSDKIRKKLDNAKPTALEQELAEYAGRSVLDSKDEKGWVHISDERVRIALGKAAAASRVYKKELGDKPNVNYLGGFKRLRLVIICLYIILAVSYVFINPSHHKCFPTGEYVFNKENEINNNLNELDRKYGSSTGKFTIKALPKADEYYKYVNGYRSKGCKLNKQILDDELASSLREKNKFFFINDYPGYIYETAGIRAEKLAELLFMCFGIPALFFFATQIFSTLGVWVYKGFKKT